MADTYYAWDPEFDCITKETDAAGATIAEYTYEPTLYGGLVSQRRGSTTNYYHYDSIGTTRALTNQAQAVTDTTVYTAFGQSIASAGTTVNPFGFVGAAGYYTGDSPSWVSVRRRSYETEQARWTSIDPLFPIGELWKYAYAGNIPSRIVDPSGLKCATGTGIVSVPGRGKFTKFIITAGVNANQLDSRPNGMKLEFNWKTTQNAFRDASGCCPCCCEKAGVLQVATRWLPANSTGTSGGVPASEIWHIDDGAYWSSWNGGWYPNVKQSSGGLCGGMVNHGNGIPSGIATLDYQDIPGIDPFGWWNRNFYYYGVKKEFITCVVCKNARPPSSACTNEAPKPFHSGPPNLFVYGCIRWGWTSKKRRTAKVWRGELNLKDWFDYRIWVDPIGEFPIDWDTGSSYDVVPEVETAGILPPPQPWIETVNRLLDSPRPWRPPGSDPGFPATGY